MGRAGYDGRSRPAASGRRQPAPVIERDSKNRQPSGQAKGMASLAPSRHRRTTPSPVVRVE